VVKGLDIFRDRFAGHAGQFVLIGGTAATLAMEDAGLPAMLELFCRSPDGIQLAAGSHLAPIPLDEAGASLSAILLDDGYYSFIIQGRRELDGLPWVGADRLIPLKARAWLDLTARKAGGEAVDTRSIRKHANDTMRLSQLLTPDGAAQLNENIAADLQRFLEGITSDGSYDPKSVDLNISLPEFVERIARAYEANTPAGT
jgi:hypothetical protein